MKSDIKFFIYFLSMFKSCHSHHCTDLSESLRSKAEAVLSCDGVTNEICRVKSCKTAVMTAFKCKFTAGVKNDLVSSIISYFRTKQQTAVVDEGFYLGLRK